jgi:hypothetical protein
MDFSALLKREAEMRKIQTEYKKSQKYVHGFPERLCYAFFAKKRLAHYPLISVEGGIV